MFNKKVFIYFAELIFILLAFSCNRNVREISLQNADAPRAMPWALPVALPWAGIVSHHTLAHEYIDAWFFNLSQARSPKRFFIISPDHYNLSLDHYSLTTGSWDSGFGIVESDIEKVLEMTRLLEVVPGEKAFEIEHGISALIPYIKKYFPQSKVVAVVISGGSGVNTLIAGRLAGVLEKEFDKQGKKENFLLISSDFSHNGSLEETAINDLKSEQYLRNSKNVSWNTVICDNRYGIYILDRLGKKSMESRILSHTNSFEISGADKDITSYFFVYFSDK